MLHGLHLTFTGRAGHERSSRPVLHLSNKDIQQSPWKSATNQKTNRSWLAGTILDGTTPMLRRSRKEKMKTFGPWLNRSMLSKRLNTIVTAIATPVRPCNNNFFHVVTLLTGAGTHARTQGIVKATLVTEKNLPKHLKQSMFAEEREWPVLCRYSSEPGDPGLDVSISSSCIWLQSADKEQDRIPQPRGFAMKVFDVHGEFFDAGKDIPTQDIEFNSTPALDLANARVTREIIDLRIKYGNNQPELYKHLEARSDTDLQKFRDQVRNTHLESTRQYSQTAYRFGDCHEILPGPKF
jgi:hypothetical protein